MKSRSNGAKLTGVGQRHAPRTERLAGLPLPSADPVLAKAEYEAIKVRERNKTARTLIICGTVVAAITVISYAALERFRAVVEQE